MVYVNFKITFKMQWIQSRVFFVTILYCRIFRFLNFVLELLN